MIFLQPLFLLGILLSVVPIIIHLWFQKRLEKIPFSTIKFLKKSEAKRFGWLKFREILILVLRCLFVAFLFLSLAKPMLKGKLFGAGHLASVYLMIDNSYSMAYGENFESMNKIVHKLFSSYSSKSEFLVLPLCRTEDDDDAKASWVSKKSAIEIIDNIQLSYKSGNIKTALSNLSTGEPRHRIQYIYIGDGQADNFRNFPKELAEQNNFYWLKIPVGNNSGITKVHLKDPIAIPLDNYKLNVHVTNFSQNRWVGRVTLKANDYYFEEDCEIQPNHKREVEFLVPVAVRHGKVVLHDDSLVVDNAYYFSKSLPQRLKVLIVGSDKYLYSALSPTGDINLPLSLETCENLSAVDLRRFNVVILNGIYEIQEGDRIKLNNFILQTNKSVICFLGAEVGKNLRDFVSKCCTIEKKISPKGYVTLDWVDHEHSIFSVFFGSTALKNIKFYHFQELVTQNNAIIAKLTGNYPLIITDNSLTVVATQFSPHATDIVYKTAFVPLLFRLIISTTYKKYDKEFYVGQKINTFEKIKAPTGEYLTKGKEFVYPGFYMANDETIAVNVDPEEGDLKILGEEAANVLNIHSISLDKDLNEGDLSTIFLYLALFALFLELTLLLII